MRPFSEPALARLRQQPWKGNVRELENWVHRAVLLASGDEIGSILPQGGTAGRARDTAGTLPLVGRTVAEVERDLILETLQHTLGNRTHAAIILGISIRTLRNKVAPVRQRGPSGAGERARRRTPPSGGTLDVVAAPA